MSAQAIKRVPRPVLSFVGWNVVHWCNGVGVAQAYTPKTDAQALDLQPWLTMK